MINRQNIKSMLFIAALSFSARTAFSQNGTYEDVKPIFDRYCVNCHGSAARAGGIDLQNFPFISVLRPTEPAAIVSRAVTRMRATMFAMPPGGGVPEEEIARIERWLAAGLPVME